MTSAVEASYYFQGLLKEAELGFECLLFPEVLIESPKISTNSNKSTEISQRVKSYNQYLNALNRKTM